MALEYLTVEHITTKDLIRIFSKIEIHPDVSFNGMPCWIWRKITRSDGYGDVSWKNEHQLSHRLMYAWLIGPLPKRRRNSPNGNSLELDHLCRRPACCNPLHIELVSHRINLERGEGIGARNAIKTHCKRGHPLDEDNTYHHAGQRACRICKRFLINRAHHRRMKTDPDYRESLRRYSQQRRDNDPNPELSKAKARERWRQKYGKGNYRI